MYISPFWFGVISTICAEIFVVFLCVFLAAAIRVGKKKDE